MDRTELKDFRHLSDIPSGYESLESRTHIFLFVFLEIMRIPVNIKYR